MFRKWFVFVLAAALLVAGLVGVNALVKADAAGVAAVEALTPEPADVVASFYGWYLDYAGYDPESGEMHNPLAEGAYADRSELSPDLLFATDSLMASFDEEGMGGYDPFLCAQNLPVDFYLTTLSVSDETAEVMVETSFSGHQFVVSLVQLGERWVMDEVMCDVE